MADDIRNIKIDSTDINKIYLGIVGISKVYLGETLVFNNPSSSGEIAIPDDYGTFVLDGVNHGTYDDIWLWDDKTAAYIQLNELSKTTDYTTVIISTNATVLATNNDVENYTGTNFVVSGYIDSGNSYPDENWLYFKLSGYTTYQEYQAYFQSNPITIYYKTV